MYWGWQLMVIVDGLGGLVEFWGFASDSKSWRRSCFSRPGWKCWASQGRESALRRTFRSEPVGNPQRS